MLGSLFNKYLIIQKFRNKKLILRIIRSKFSISILIISSSIFNKLKNLMIYRII